MVGIPARPTVIDAQNYNSFVPYGTPCSERFDPATQQLELLKCEVETLRGKLAKLIEASAAAMPATRRRDCAADTDRQSPDGGRHTLSDSRADRRWCSFAPNCSASSISTAAWWRPAIGAIMRSSFGRDAASFACFRRTAERPEYRIEKRPALRQRQGEWALIGEAGVVLKRGHELGPVLAPIERKLLKLVED
jgi:hypothetical protein